MTAPKYENVREKLEQLLKKIDPSKNPNFSGIGLVVYDSQYLDKIPHCSLRPSIGGPKGINIDNAVEYLESISDINHSLHDGYHFFNEKGELTHVAQYLGIPIASEVKPNELYGTRHLTAQFASRLKGVVAVGTVSHNKSASYFESGTYFNVSDPWDKIYEKEGLDYQYYDVTVPHEDINKVIAEMKKRSVSKALDIGCGAGRNMIPMVSNGIKCWGVDDSAHGIEMCRKSLKKFGYKANLETYDIHDGLKYKDNFFDAVISVQTLSHGKEKQTLEVISEIHRVLRPGGLLFVTLCGTRSKGKLRYCLVKTAKKIAPRTYVPTIGNEIGLTHFMYNWLYVRKHFFQFSAMSTWKDSMDYFCLLAENKK